MVEPTGKQRPAGSGARGGPSRKRKAAGRQERRDAQRAAAADREERVPIPLGVKFAVFTVALLVVLIVAVGRIFSGVAVKSIDERINSEGSQIASTVALTIDRIFWTRPRENGEISDAKWQVMKNRASSFWNESLSDLVSQSSDIRQVIIVDDIESDKQRQFVSSHPDPMTLTGERELSRDEDSRITEGQATTGSGTERTRRFDAPIRDSRGKTVAWAGRKTLWSAADVSSAAGWCAIPFWAEMSSSNREPKWRTALFWTTAGWPTAAAFAVPSLTKMCTWNRVR